MTNLGGGKCWNILRAIRQFHASWRTVHMWVPGGVTRPAAEPSHLIDRQFAGYLFLMYYLRFAVLGGG